MSQPFTSRGLAWFQALAGSLAPRPGDPASLRVADAELDGYPVRFLAVVPDPGQSVPARSPGEVGQFERLAWPPPSTRRWRPTARRRAARAAGHRRRAEPGLRPPLRSSGYPPGAGRAVWMPTPAPDLPGIH